MHPIFLWGPGAGTTPSTYESYLTTWASHGFVVYSIVSTGDGTEMIAGIDWLVRRARDLDTLATPNCQRDYDNTTVPVFFTVMEGVDHYYAARNGLPAITAWLRWHLGGEEDRRAMFLDPKPA